MPNQWNALIATQTVGFRGSSAVGVKTANPNFPDVRCLTKARYAMSVAGGVSGSFAVNIVGHIGGSTYHLAGVTAISAAGSYVFAPFGYYNGAPSTPVLLTGLSSIVDVTTLMDVIPPSAVHFLSAVTSTVGISANCTVSACLMTE